MQDLDEQIAALTKACIDYFGVEPAFSLRIEVQPKLPVVPIQMLSKLPCHGIARVGHSSRFHYLLQSVQI